MSADTSFLLIAGSGKPAFCLKKEFSFPESSEKQLFFCEVDKYAKYRIGIDRFYKKPIPEKKQILVKLYKMQKFSCMPIFGNYFRDMPLTFLCMVDKIKLVKTEEEYLVYQEIF